MDSKRLILAALLSIIVLVGWGLLFPPPERPQGQQPIDEGAAFPFETDDAALTPTVPAPQATTSVTQPVNEPGAVRSGLPAVVAGIEREVEVESGGVLARFSNRGAQLLSLRLKNTLGHDGEFLEMVRTRSPEGPFPFALVEADGQDSPLNTALFEVVEESGGRVRFHHRSALGEATKEFVFGGDGLFEVSVEVPGRTDWSLLLGPGLRNPNERELKGTYTLYRRATYAVGDGLEQIDANKPDAATVLSGNGVRWIGLEDTYFLTALVPSGPFRSATVEAMLPQLGRSGENSYIAYPQQLTEEQEDLRAEYRVLLNPGTESFTGQAYWGPKRFSELRELPGSAGLEETVDWGWFGFLALPMLIALLWIHDNIVQNFGWSIVLLTVCIKIVMAPLTHKSYVSSRKMQALQPKMNAIKQKYRAKLKDKKGRPNMEAQRKQNEELQALMREEGVNPLGGCLPILLQMPFFFAFFTLLRNSVELWNAPWAFWIHDLSAPDPLYILPVVMGASQFLQQRLVGTTSMEPAQRMMMNVMPIMFMFFFFQAPSGLVLYWVTSNLLTIAQQGVYQRLRSAGVLGAEPDASKP